eukprot:jgi/Psemu1/304363/fgenesh1_kg.148_\
MPRVCDVVIPVTYEGAQGAATFVGNKIAGVTVIPVLPVESTSFYERTRSRKLRGNYCGVFSALKC